MALVSVRIYSLMARFVGLHFQCFCVARLDFKLARALALFTFIFPANGFIFPANGFIVPGNGFIFPANGLFFLVNGFGFPG